MNVNSNNIFLAIFKMAEIIKTGEEQDEKSRSKNKKMQVS